MAQNSKIEWCHHTVNLWWGCTEVHAGCDNCYAKYLSDVRYKNNLWGNDRPRKAIKSCWSDLAKFQKLAKEAGEIHRVFINSMSDIFEKTMLLVDNKGNWVTDGAHDYPTYTDALRDQLFEEISEGKYPNLLFLLLTKRPSNINKYIPDSWKTNPPDNVMFGTSPVNQSTTDTLIRQLLEVNGKHFLSVEPQLAHIDLGRWLGCGKIDWVIQGGESGHNKRPFKLEWAREMRDDCKYHNVPYFFKQIDKVQHIPDDLLIREFPPLKIAV